MRLGEIARVFGTVFSESLAEQETGQWVGPLQSGFGAHLVFINERIEGSKPDLEQVRDAVQRDWFSQRRREAVDGLYTRLAESYQIELESPEVASATVEEAVAQ
jgi:parvulin-like peptidyl-prolyl isomerase